MKHISLLEKILFWLYLIFAIVFIIYFVFKLLILLGFWPEGKVLPDIDKKLEEVIERQLTSPRVGKMMLK